MNTVYEADQTGADKIIIWSALSKLIDYAEKHFKVEEAYMESVSYPELDEHRAMHVDIMNNMKEVARTYENAPDSASLERFIGFLKWWLIHHINHTDKKYSPIAA